MTEAAAWRVVLRATVLVFSLLFVVYLARELRAVILQVLLAIILAAAATPLVDALTISGRARRWRWRPHRGLAAALIFVSAILLLVLAAFTVFRAVGPDVWRFATNLPRYVEQIQTAYNDFLAANPDIASRLTTDGAPPLQGLLQAASGMAAQAPRVVGVAADVFSGVLYMVFALILALYLTIDGDRIRRYVIELMPHALQTRGLNVSGRIGDRLGAWARGEIVLGAIVGTLTWLGALLIGLPYAGALALIAAIGELVPNIGPIVAGVILVLVGFLTSPTQGLLALGLAILVQQLENNLIVPRVMSQAVDLHPVVVMVAILAGNELLGIPGALLAVPVVASISVVVSEIQRERTTRRVTTQRSEEAQRERAAAAERSA
jgi:predicted PurR-regulated permease PerM